MFRQVFITAIVATLLQNACTAQGAAVEPAGDEAPLDIAISTILKDPWRYHGKLVRVRGTFDECISTTCLICEGAPPFPRDDDIDDTCMGVSFYSESQILQPDGSEEQQALMHSRAEALAEREVRFATVTLEARYDAGCSPNPNSDIITMCTDRASQLREARTVRVHIRRPATAGHITQYFDETLTVPDRIEAKALAAAFRAASSASGSDEENKPDYLFLEQPIPADWRKKYGVEAMGGACKCSLEDCSGVQWPRRIGDAVFDIPANSYKCWRAEKVGGVWKFPLQ